MSLLLVAFLFLRAALQHMLDGDVTEPEWHPRGQADLDHYRQTGRWPQ